MSEEDGNNAVQRQLADMQQLLNTQLEIMKLQATNNATLAGTVDAEEAQAASTVRRLSTPAARYDMTAHEFRSYKKDCLDFKKLMQNSDKQMVVQMRITMDFALKQAIDANYSATWEKSFLYSCRFLFL